MAAKVIGKKADVEAGTIVLTFGEGFDPLVFDAHEVPELDYDSLPLMGKQLVIHGASQKIGDSYAGAKTATEGTDADPVQWSYDRASEAIQNILDGNWTVRTGGGPTVTDLAVALSEVTGATLEEAIARLAEAEDEEKKGLRAHPDIAAVLARLRRERAEAKEKAAAAKRGSGPDLTEFMQG